MLAYSRMPGMAIAVLCVLFAGPAPASTSDELKALREEVGNIRQAQRQMQQDLDEIKRLLTENPARAATRAAPATPPFKPTEIQLDEVPYMGQYDAPVTLVEFSDYQCPYCKRHANTVMPELIAAYVDTGKVRFVMREYPIERIHRRAGAAAEAALCAGDQGRYWGMHDMLINDQKANTDEDFQRAAASLGLDMAAFSACVDSDRFMLQIKQDLAEGQRLGVSGTPSFVMGLTDADDPDKVHLSKFIRGAQSLQVFSAAIDELLNTVAPRK